MVSKILVWAAVAYTGLASPLLSTPVLHERRDPVPSVFKRTTRLDAGGTLLLRIALQQGNLEHGYEHLQEVSHPASPKYGQHWTADEVDTAFAPDAASIEAVRTWLSGAGIDVDGARVTKGWLALDTPVGEVERLLRAEYYEHEDEDGKIRIGCDSYHIPEHLTQHIDYIKPGIVFSPPVTKTIQKRSTSSPSPIASVYASEIQNLTTAYFDLILNQTTDKFPLLAQAATLLNDTDTCGSIITPLCIRALYNIPRSNLNDSINTLGLYESEGQVYDTIDLNDFFATFIPNATNVTLPDVTSINGAAAEGPPEEGGGEILLDLDIAYSLVYPQSVRIFESQGSTNINKTYYDDYQGYEAFFDAIDGSYCGPDEGDEGADCGTAHLTRVTSFSYGVPEILLPEKAAVRMCNEFMKLSLQGYTFCGSSGDYGVASHPLTNTTGCISASNVTHDIQNGTIFNPQFPDNCPYVLGVGATQLDPNETVYGQESVAVYASEDNALHQGSGGGGFSNYFPAPTYQQSALDTYFATHDPGYPTYNYSGDGSIGANAGRYNRAGRGIPDVSANGNNLLVFRQNQVHYTGGTSMSTPIWASILTLINEERTAVGKGPVGFVQPVLYEHSEVFNDITRGSNPGCGTDGFSAVEGWDPVTGLGTPDFSKLLEIFLNLP